MTHANLTAPGSDKTREKWLHYAAHYILDDIIMPEVEKEYSYPKPAFKVSTGFPYRSRNGKVIGQCFKRDVSRGSFNEIFITPLCDESLRVLDILTHELIHAVDNCESGHKNFFAYAARAAGLAGKLTATEAGPELAGRLQEFIDARGQIPHSAMDLSNAPGKKQGTRMKKIECGHCGFIFRAAQKWANLIHKGKSPCPVCRHTELEKEE